MSPRRADRVVLAFGVWRSPCHSTNDACSWVHGCLSDLLACAFVGVCRPSPFVEHNNFGGGFGELEQEQGRVRNPPDIQKLPFLLDAVMLPLTQHNRRVPATCQLVGCTVQCLTWTEWRSQPCALAHQHQQVSG